MPIFIKFEKSNVTYGYSQYNTLVFYVSDHITAAFQIFFAATIVSDTQQTIVSSFLDRAERNFE